MHREHGYWRVSFGITFGDNPQRNFFFFFKSRFSRSFSCPPASYFKSGLFLSSLVGGGGGDRADYGDGGDDGGERVRGDVGVDGEGDGGPWRSATSYRSPTRTSSAPSAPRIVSFMKQKDQSSVTGRRRRIHGYWAKIQTELGILCLGAGSRFTMSWSATTDAYPAVFKIGFGNSYAAYRSVQVLTRSIS